MVRTYVKKWSTCQQQQTRVHKAALVPITAKTLYERMVIDLIDFELKPSHDYRYILHVVDHFSKHHMAWAMKNKRPATIAFHLSGLFAETGAPKLLQCDQRRSSSLKYCSY